MRHDAEDNTIYTLAELKSRLNRLSWDTALPCLIALAYGLLRLYFFPSGGKLGLAMTVGAVLSLLSVLLYSAGIYVLKVKHNKKWPVALFNLSGFAPYLFGIFLVFYKGVLACKYLAGSFSFWILSDIFIWILLGFRILAQFYAMIKLGSKIDSGEVKIEARI